MKKLLLGVLCFVSVGSAENKVAYFITKDQKIMEEFKNSELIRAQAEKKYSERIYQEDRKKALEEKEYWAEKQKQDELWRRDCIGRDARYKVEHNCY